ncbi:MAG: hypothetical protein P4L33_21630 [Capsulimonadaceae bacterium]|nr:hypothetical protein [Capsulimonadaceae bacterium]
MANRVCVYGIPGERDTERILRELYSMSLNYDFYGAECLPGEVVQALPRVEIACGADGGTVAIENPDAETLRQTLYAHDILGVTSYWV